MEENFIAAFDNAIKFGEACRKDIHSYEWTDDDDLNVVVSVDKRMSREGIYTIQLYHPEFLTQPLIFKARYTGIRQFRDSIYRTSKVSRIDERKLIEISKEVSFCDA